MRIFIVGSGIVAEQTGRSFCEQSHEVTFVGQEVDRIEALAAQGLDVRPELDLRGEPESFIYLCLPTSGPGTRCDLSRFRRGVETVGRALALADSRHTVVVRSAVPPGTTRHLVAPCLERCSGKLENAGFALVAGSPQVPRQDRRFDWFEANRAHMVIPRSRRELRLPASQLTATGSGGRVVTIPRQRTR